MTPALCVTIAAADDQASIGDCIDSILASAAAAREPVEILVALSGSSDQTQAIAQARGARCLLQGNGHNLSATLNAAVRASSAPAIATISAKSRMAPDMVAMVVDYAYDGAYIGGQMHDRPLGLAGDFFPALAPSRAPTAFWFPRESFEAVGGFDDATPGLAAQPGFALKLRALGKARAKKYASLHGIASRHGRRLGAAPSRPLRDGLRVAKSFLRPLGSSNKG